MNLLGDEKTLILYDEKYQQSGIIAFADSVKDIKKYLNLYLYSLLEKKDSWTLTIKADLPKIDKEIEFKKEIIQLLINNIDILKNNRLESDTRKIVVDFSIPTSEFIKECVPEMEDKPSVEMSIHLGGKYKLEKDDYTFKTGSKYWGYKCQPMKNTSRDIIKELNLVIPSNIKIIGRDTIDSTEEEWEYAVSGERWFFVEN